MNIVFMTAGGVWRRVDELRSILDIIIKSKTNWIGQSVSTAWLHQKKSGVFDMNIKKKNTAIDDMLEIKGNTGNSLTKCREKWRKWFRK